MRMLVERSLTSVAAACQNAAKPRRSPGEDGQEGGGDDDESAELAPVMLMCRLHAEEHKGSQERQANQGADPGTVR